MQPWYSPLCFEPRNLSRVSVLTSHGFGFSKVRLSTIRKVGIRKQRRVMSVQRVILSGKQRIQEGLGANLCEQKEGETGSWDMKQQRA